MMYDLLEVDNDIISTKDETSDKTIKAQFEDSDDLFSRYRYRHIAEVLQKDIILGHGRDPRRI